jgi:hypothetical protein
MPTSETVVLFCPECGTARNGQEPFCAHCGHAFAVVPASDLTGAATGSPSNRVWLIAGAAVFVVALVATLVVVLLMSRSSDDKNDESAPVATEPWSEALADAADDLDPERYTLMDVLPDQDPNSAVATAIIDAVVAYRPVLKGWIDGSDALEDADDPTKEQRAALRTAVDAEDVLLGTITRVARTPSTANRNEMVRAAQASVEAWGELDEASGGDVEIEPLDVGALTDWSMQRETARRTELQDRAATRAEELRDARRRAAEAEARREAAEADAAAPSGDVTCANIGEGGMGVIDIAGSNVTCGTITQVIDAMPAGGPATYTTQGFFCEVMARDSASVTYICQDGDRSLGFRVIDS